MQARGVARIARTELRRTWRSVVPDADADYRLLKLAGLTVGYLVYALGLGAAAFFLGAVLARGGLDTDPRPYARAIALAPYVMVGFVAIQRVLKQVGDPDERDLLLTTTDHRTVTLGIAAAELARYLAVVGPLYAVAGIGYAAGTAHALAGVLLVVALALATVAAGALGYTAGFVAKLVATRVAVVARHSTLVGFLAAAAIPVLYAVVFLRNPSASVDVATAVAAAFPPAWIGVLPLASIPGTVGTGLLGVAGTVVLAGVALAAACPLAAAVWYGDPVRPAESSSGLLTADALALPGLPTTSRRVAQKSIVRSVRAPFTVQYAIVPVFVLFGELQYVIANGTIPTRLPIEVGFVGAVAAGALFTLNPIGNESAVLPVTLTTGVDGRAFVGGLVFAELLLVLPATFLGVVGLGVLSGLALPWLAAALLATVVAAVGATGIAARFGARHPSHETQSVGNREAVTPSGWAFGEYALTMVVACAPGVLAYVTPVTDRLATATNIAVGPLRVGLLALTVLALVALGYGGYASAVRVVETYTLD